MCGEYGHHSRNYPQNEKNGFKLQVGNNKSRVKCHYFGEKGHCMGGCKVKKKAEMIKSSKAKEFENLRLTRSTNPRKMKASRRLAFNQKRVLVYKQVGT